MKLLDFKVSQGVEALTSHSTSHLSFLIHDMGKLMTYLLELMEGLNENACLEHGKCSEKLALTIHVEQVER